MDWLRKHWKGIAFWVASAIGTIIIEKSVDSTFSASLLASTWAFLNTSWSVPVWLLLIAFGLMLWLAVNMAPTKVAVQAPTSDLALSQDQETVLREILVYYREDVPATLSNLEFSICIPKLTIECAIDVLAQKGLISWDQDLFESPEYRAELTAKGRAYALTMQNPAK